VRGEVDRAKRGRVRGFSVGLSVSKEPLAPTLSPLAERGRISW
jgi:hypothetical protein